MAAILTGKSWRDFLEKNTHLPAAFDREHASHDINSPVCINLKAIQGVLNREDDENIKFQVSMSLYDTTYKQFFGRQWKGPLLSPNRGTRLQYNKSVYFHTSAGTSSVVLVFELQAETVGRDGRPRREACGWGLVRPFGYEASDMPDSSRGIQPATQKIHLYHGSPRALYYMEEPIEANQYLKTIEGCTLTCAVMAHKALRRVMTLLPENTLVDSNDIIPGMVDVADGDRFKKPQRQRKVPIVIEGLVIQLQPNVDKFEDKLCELMRADRALRENRTEETTDVIIVERRLQVGVHNGWCYLDKPVVFHLDKQSARGVDTGRKPTASPSLRRSSMYHIRRNSTGSSSGGDSSNMVLTLKNRIQIDELLEDPMCAVVFTLEYIIGEPLSAQDRKTSLSMTRAHTRTLHVRWGSWTPLLHPNTSEITMALVGGPNRSPDDALAYKLPATNMQHESTAMSAGGLLAFRWAKDGESIQHTMPSNLMVPPYNQIGSAASLRSEVSDGMMVESNTSGDLLRLKPPMGKLSVHRPSVVSNRSQLSVGFAAAASELSLPNQGPRSPRSQMSRGYLQLQSQPQAAMFSSAAAAATGPAYGYQQHAAGAASAAGVPPQMAGTVPYMAPQQYNYPQQMMGMVSAPQQFMPMGSMYPGMYAPQAGLMPIDVMHVQETAASSELKDLPYTPVHSLVLAQGPNTKGGRGLSRAAYARLYAAGFSPLRDRNGEPPEVIDPHGQHLINVAREQVDPLQANEVIFQFLAYSKEPAAGGASFVDNQSQASTVYFTFQFYRFPQVTTERMLLAKAQTDLSANPQAMPFILQRLNPDGSVMDCPPGLEVKYPIDPTFLKPGEVTMFWEHLARQTMHIDVWDGDSLLLIGSCSVELKYLFRGGNEAVQTTFELDVVTSEYQEDSGALTGDVSRGGSIHPVGVNCVNRGKLHFRLANIGYPISKRKQELIPVPSKTQVVVSQTAGNSAYKGGSLTSVIPPSGTKKVRIARAKHLAENSEVASLLFSEQKRLESLKLGEDRDDDEEELVPKEGAAEAQRKLARLKAVQAKRSGEEEDNRSKTIIGYRSEKTERTRDFKTMDIYRNQTKRDGIINMLNTSITTDHTIFPSFGTAEFFEFVVKNPFNHEETVTIEINDPELHLVTDAREWRHYKQLCRLTTPLEENMFTSASSDKNKPQIFLRPKETVNIPLKYQSFKSDHSVQPQGPTNPFDKKTCLTELDKSLESKMIRVMFRSEAGKALAVLNVRVDPQPHVIDQTLRFYHPENCFLKKSVRLPPFHGLPGGAVGGSGISQVFVRCSDSHVILDCKPTQPGEPHDIFMKVALAASPQVKRFFVCAYIDPFLSRPAQIWQCYVHALQRVDVTCVEAQSTHVSLLLRGTQASRVVKCYSSHGQELQIQPKDPFILAAGTVHELDVAVRPLRPGSKFFYLNVVDPEYHQLIRSWLVCAGCRSPIVSRAFELSLPVGGGGRHSSKRITYTNPYPVARKFHLLCDRNDLLQFKETVIEIGPGEPHPIGLRFLPVMQPGIAEIMVFINDEEDKNEETFRVTANYKFV